jgi:hypothetical protein
METSKEVQVIERLSQAPILHGDQRCITLDLVDELHERPSGTARVAFNRHKKRMVEGRHYHAVTVKELRELRMPGIRNSERGNPDQKTYLLTEKGYALLAKVFDDERAWQIQEALVDGYFRQRETDAGLGGKVLRALEDFAARLERQEAITSTRLMLAGAGPVQDLVTIVGRVRQRCPAISRRNMTRCRDVACAIYRERLGRDPRKLTGDDNSPLAFEREYLHIIDEAIDIIEEATRRKQLAPSLFRSA